MEITISTYHWGHVEFFLCNADSLGEGGVVTQECFNKYPLSRSTTVDSVRHIDPEHPGRYFMDPSCVSDQSGGGATAVYDLPDGLSCERCVVQMIYYTGNSCMHPGYDEFNPSSFSTSSCAPLKDNWIKLNLGMCGVDGNYPEEFWNCADISITSEGGISSKPPAGVTSSDEEKASEENKSCSSVWQQCGGIGWNGANTCCNDEDEDCVSLSEYYFQCVPRSFGK